MGLSLLVPTGERLPSLMTVKVPEGVDELKARKQLLEQFGLEIGGGLGPLKGKIWRVGLMGAGSTRRNITLCLTALQTALGAQGFKVKGDPLGAVQAAYDKQS
jgi:alanine-glyoxylate transaminase/serine-glyoxylate transaminase/serine-pyruvate transaminase